MDHTFGTECRLVVFVILVKPIVILNFDKMSGHYYVDAKRRRIQAVIGNDLLLSYVVEGSPLPKLSWYKNGHKLKSDPIVQFSDNMIAMRRLIADDAGLYQIVVKNSAGESRSDFQLRVFSK